MGFGPRSLLLGGALLLLSGGLPASLAAAPVPVDRVVAFVDGEPLLDSEVEAVIALGLVAPMPGEDRAGLHRRTLDLLVDDRLRAKDLARFGEPTIPPEEVENEIDRAAAQLGGRDELERIARMHGFDVAWLRALFRRQLASLEAADERFGGAIFVSDDEVADFVACDAELRDRLEREGIRGTATLDPQLRAEVRELLLRRRLGEQLDRWMSGLREKARIEYRDGRAGRGTGG